MQTKSKNSSPVSATELTARPRFIVVHGEKGGVGKSFVSLALADYLSSTGTKVAVLDADTSNPDVSRMFANSAPCAQVNISNENGWMDIVDFVVKHPSHTIVMNTPAGADKHIFTHLPHFANFLAEQESPVDMELWWTMNLQHDSVNQLNSANNAYGKYFKQVRIICNLHFANGDKDQFFLWQESPLRTKIENNLGVTVYFPGLHLRVVGKVFTPGKSMPFSDAADAAAGEKVGLEYSERWKLQQWLTDVKNLFQPLLQNPVATQDVATVAR
jgi:NUBPL iron-transfer P-loop NTPase